jgi:tRNA threonylcarbamoyladenosine biosynthesis protein TsaB
MKRKEGLMYQILIDSSDRYNKSVSLVKAGKVVAEKKGDIDVVVSIRDLLKENNLTFSEIDIIKANPGPGSFTGLKIGVTVANVLNWALGKKKSTEMTMPEYGSEPNIHKTKWIEE